MTTLTHKYAVLGAMVTMGAMDPTLAFAQSVQTGTSGITPVKTTEYTDQSFSTIFERVATSFGGLPGLIANFAYLMGIVFAIGGILKVKEHVEDPSRTQLKDGAMRLVAGGALFALPWVMSTMTATIGDSTANIGAPELNKAGFGVR